MSAKARFDAIQSVVTRKAQGTLQEKRPQSAHFGEQTFSLQEAQRRLPKDVFKKLRETVLGGAPLDPAIAPAVAHGLKEWALERGATHFTHLFQPMTGITAEKHDSFLSYEGDGLIERFGGRELVQGEPDASSFPSGGLRATFEARGYTAWDPTTSPFLVKHPNGATLTIPSAFVSYTGESLDEKTPMLRSQEAISSAAMRLLRLTGRSDVKRVTCTMGPEQEYFLVDRAFFALRPDLVACGRTVFGAPPPKGQELEDQYFGAIKDRILAVMSEVEHEAIGLGIPVKTRHNEVAPAQYECAPIFEVVNRAADHNLLILELFRRIAPKHGLAFLDHEKPFAGINGSGKHNNWSMATDGGENLLEPGTTPIKNTQFLLFLAATIRAVFKHGGLLRSSVASAGNDHRLGANEAPPAIMSVFIGDELQGIFEQIGRGSGAHNDKRGTIDLAVSAIPAISKDTTDRNRTSPFAFTGNKFEFRAVGSSQNISWPNTIINTIVAESIDYVADRLEAELKAGLSVGDAAAKILPGLVAEVSPVVFNGNNYDEAWHREAERRGLANDRDTPAALRHLVSEPSLALFERYKVLNRKEAESRYTVRLENYCKRVAIEAKVAVEMARTGVLPAAFSYLGRLAPLKDVPAAGEAFTEVSKLANSVAQGIKALEAALGATHHVSNVVEEADAFRAKVLPAMLDLRASVDALEVRVDDDLWPYPKYREMLFMV
ncbi:MAG: glutamine synthetase III [Polyangiaceae bacterium]|jgi:glutamine synthetase|nr:glutamine synthetase III [Polyangiaceae bacterium]